jgi:hypothetical protein
MSAPGAAFPDWGLLSRPFSGKVLGTLGRAALYPGKGELV